MLSPDPYRIEKSRVAVVLRLRSGERIRGAIFVQPSAYLHFEREEPVDLFNAAEPFLPVEVDGGDVLLVAKDHVVEVEGAMGAHDDDLRLASARAATLTVTLSDGVVRTGKVFLEMPSDRARVLDYLNSIHDRFFVLHDEDEIYLINARAVEHVRPRD